MPWLADTCTRTHGLALAAWGRVSRIGTDGYLRMAGSTLRAVEALVSGVGGIPGLHLAHVPDAAVVVLRTDTSCDAATIAERLRPLGWYAAAQPAWRLLPPTLRLEVDARTDVDALLVALEAATLAARAEGPAVLPTRLLDHLARLDPTHLSTGDVGLLLDALGLDPATAEHSARFALLLDSAHTRLREALVARLRELVHRPLRG